MWARLADRKRTFLYGCRAHIRSCSSKWAGLARGLNTLRSVRSTRTGFALSFHCQLLTGSTLVSAFLMRDRFRGSCRLTQTTEEAWETAFVRLEESVSAAATQTCFVVVVFSSWTTFLAVRSTSGSRSDCYAWTSGYYWTRAAFQLSGFTLVCSYWTGLAFFCDFIVECSNRAGY